GTRFSHRGGAQEAWAEARIREGEERGCYQRRACSVRCRRVRSEDGNPATDELDLHPEGAGGTAHSVREFVEAGGLMSYGTSLFDMYQQVGVYAGRILNGASPDHGQGQSGVPTIPPTPRLAHRHSLDVSNDYAFGRHRTCLGLADANSEQDE